MSYVLLIYSLRRVPSYWEVREKREVGAVNPEVARWPCVSRRYFWGALLLRPRHAMEKQGPISSVWVERRRILNILWWYDLQAGSTSESNTAHSQALPKGVCLGTCSSWTQAAMNMQLAPNQRRKLGDCKPSHLWFWSYGALKLDDFLWFWWYCQFWAAITPQRYELQVCSNFQFEEQPLEILTMYR